MAAYRSFLVAALVLLALTTRAGGIADAREGGHWHGAVPERHWVGPEHGVGPERHGEARPEWGWHGVDIDRWHGGRWFHGEHLGRLGWWWIVGDGWYFYPAPVYPYPDPYVPPAVAAPTPGYWYYCASANAYYPYVGDCPEGWRAVVPPR